MLVKGAPGYQYPARDDYIHVRQFRNTWFTGGLLYGTYTTINDYMQRQVIHLTEIKHEVPIEFPAVTVCNLNPFDQSDLDDVGFCAPKGLFIKVLNYMLATGLAVWWYGLWLIGVSAGEIGSPEYR